MRMRVLLMAIAVVIMAASVSRNSHAQATCMNGGFACSAPEACTDSGCREPIYCQKDGDCANEMLGCDTSQYRCLCMQNADCGTFGACVEGVCKRLDERPECTRACIMGADCGQPLLCTFAKDATEFGLCCPAAAVNEEEDFSCSAGSSKSMGGREMILLAFALACIARGRTRTRLGG